MPPRYRDFKLSFWILIFAVFTMRIGQFMVLPFFAIMVTQQFHGSPVVAGWVVAMGPLSYALASFNSGHLTDKYGAKNIILCSLAIGGVGFLAMYSWHAIIAFLLVSLVLGVSRSAFNAASRAYIFLEVAEELRTLAFGVNYIAVNVGFGVGLLIGTLYAAHNSDGLFLWAAVSYCILAVILIFILPKITINKEKNLITLAATIRIILVDRRLLYLTLALIIAWVAYTQIDSVLPIYLVHTAHNGVITFAKIIAVNAVVASVLQPFVSKIMSRFSYMKQIIVAMSLLVLGYLCYVEFTSTLWFMVGMGVLTLGEIIFLPLVDVWIGALASKERAGAYYAAGNFFMLGNAIGPVLGGWVYEHYSFRLVYILCAIITVAVVPLFKKALPAA